MVLKLLLYRFLLPLHNNSNKCGIFLGLKSKVSIKIKFTDFAEYKPQTASRLSSYEIFGIFVHLNFFLEHSSF